MPTGSGFEAVTCGSPEAMIKQTDVQVQPEAVSTLIDRIVLTDEIGRLAHPRGTILPLAFWEGRSYRRSLSNLIFRSERSRVTPGVPCSTCVPSWRR